MLRMDIVPFIQEYSNQMAHKRREIMDFIVTLARQTTEFL